MTVTDGISVVIPNYNGAVLLPQTLPLAIAALKETGLPYEIIVSDDCSTDDSVRMLQKEFPGIKCIINQQNSGFSITSNKGIHAAAYNWVLLLNSDVKLEQDYFQPLLKYSGREDVFGVMGRIIGWEDEKIQDGAKYPLFHGVKIKTSENYLLADTQKMKDGLYTMYVSGANAFINKNIFLAIGGFNELFSPFYAEDTELSIRAWRLGYSCLYDHFAVCRHRTSSTIATSRRKKQINMIYNRNKMYLHAIHLDFPQITFWFLQMLAEVFMRLIFLQFDYIKSFLLFIKNYEQVIKSRKQLRRNFPFGRLIPLKIISKKIADAVHGENLIRFKS